MFTERVTPRMADRELVKHRLPVTRLFGQPGVREFDAGKILRRDRLTAGGPASQVRQFDIEQRTLKPIHPEIAADNIVIVTPVRAVHADVTRLGVDAFVLRNEGP